MRPIEIRRGNTVVLVGRTGAFPKALLVAGDDQRRDAFIVNLPQERAALEQIRREWTNVFPAAMPEQLSSVEIVKTMQRGVRSGAVQVVLLRSPRMPIAPAGIQQVSSGVINAGTAQQRLLIARMGGLPPEFLPFRNPARAMAALGQMANDSPTARQIDLQAGRLSGAGGTALHGKSLRQNLAWQINAGALDVAVIAHAPAVATARSRPDAPKSIADMSGDERIGAALQRSLPYAVEAGGEEIRHLIEEMIRPRNILIMIGMAVAVAIANLNPLSGAAVNTTLLLLAWWNGGSEAIAGVTAFAMASLDARDATTEAELDAAARAYGKALGKMGPKLLGAIVNKFLKKGGGKGDDEAQARRSMAPSKQPPATSVRPDPHTRNVPAGKNMEISHQPQAKPPLAVSPKVVQARARQEQMLEDDIGFNISPSSWDKYPSVGRNGSFLSDKKAMDKLLPEISNGASGEIKISKARAAQIETEMGIDLGSLADGFKVRKVENIGTRAPRSPMEGNDHFLGPGNHLPGGHPEVAVESIPTTDGNGVSTVLKIVVGD